MSELNIRAARAGDQAAIRAVTLDAYQEYAAIMQAQWDGYRQNILATLANVAPAEQLVAELDGALIGTVLLFPADMVFTTPDGHQVRTRWPEIRLLAVAPAARGHGVGAALAQACIQRARQAGATAISLHTTDMMGVAQAMYVRMGFQRSPETDFHPSPSITVKGYRLPLDEAPAA